MKIPDFFLLSKLELSLLKWLSTKKACLAEAESQFYQFWKDIYCPPLPDYCSFPPVIRFFYETERFTWIYLIWVLSQAETIIILICLFGKNKQIHKMTTTYSYSKIKMVLDQKKMKFSIKNSCHFVNLPLFAKSSSNNNIVSVWLKN